MAIAPLWVVDRATLLSELRLGGVPLTGDAAVMIDQAIEKARIRIYQRLGIARVTAITALTYSENPTTADGITRAVARMAEITLCRALLSEMLPVLFMDPSTSGPQQTWNEIDGGWRATTDRDRQRMFTKQMTEVEVLFQHLDGSVALGETHVNAIYTQKSACPTPRPGASPWIRQPWGDGENVKPGGFDGNFVPPLTRDPNNP